MMAEKTNDLREPDTKMMIVNMRLCNEIIEAVERMRHAQKDYFRTKGNLAECKQYEGQVDRLLQKYRDKQKRLFE